MAQNGLGRLACGQVGGDTRKTKTFRALLYVLVGHPNDMEEILVDMIVNTNKIHNIRLVYSVIWILLNIFFIRRERNWRFGPSGRDESHDRADKDSR